MEQRARLLLGFALLAAAASVGYAQSSEQEPYLVFPGGQGPFIPHKPPRKDGISPNASAGFITGFSIVFCVLLLLTTAVIKLYADVKRLRADVDAHRAQEESRLILSGGGKF
ncbi:hypothetical protein KFL_005780030 [Klebsormidium nitens]|uniref:Uncharacterized protein n=1 Tax=Klebsormidium nitens TaxID=105231 RepID=A0A1Y1IGF5_KLENI|nr:hypothetical protein KFL_005780030 [Klebsormidium nitens]|eukprot:GAQ89925.1 hypothetical protein KFL_005780030 [Klebsormidium nitens]